MKPGNGSGRLENKLRINDLKLNTILDITRAINNQVPSSELVDIVLHVLTGPLKVERVLLYTNELSGGDVWQCIAARGIDGDPSEVSGEDFFMADSGVTVSLTGQSKAHFDVVIPVKHDEQPIAYLLVGDLGEKDGVSPAIKHMRFIETLTNIVMVALRNRRLMQENLEQAAIKKELELAAEMQYMLMPRELPKNEHMEVAGVYRPHREVGGDYYDFVEVTDNVNAFCMADVSGKGLSAAFLMSNFQAYLRAIFKYRFSNLSEIVKELNNRVMESANGEKYITFFLALHDKSSGVLHYVNCGHNPPVLIEANGKSHLLAEGTIGLGMFDALPSVSTGSLKPECPALLTCFTDGLVEQEDETLEAYGADRLETFLLLNKEKPIDEIAFRILEDLDRFRGETPYMDDTALLCARFLK